MKQHKGEMGRQWTGSEMGKKIKEKEYPEVVPLTNALNTTMGLTPFYANKGYHPSITVHPECNIASTRA